MMMTTTMTTVTTTCARHARLCDCPLLRECALVSPHIMFAQVYQLYHLPLLASLHTASAASNNQVRMN